MDSKINFKLAGTLLIIAIFLVTVAFFTITSSFAIDYSSEPKVFDVAFVNLKSNTMDTNNISLRKNNVMFNINLNKENNINSFIFDIENKGSMDAIIRNVSQSKLDDYLFSYNDRDYYLSDFVFYNIYYTTNNKSNNIVLDSGLRTKDLIKSGTYNQVGVKVRLKRDDELNNDSLEALNHYLTNNNIEKTLYLDASFSEL